MMKKFTKRLISWLLCLVMALGFVPLLEKNADAAAYGGGMPGSGRIVAHGLDVSAWQESGLSFQNIASAGYDYVILRVGTSVRKDTCFEEFYVNAKAAGLDVGCYFYSYALTEAQARQEAYDVLSWIQGKKFEYPIYFDFEDPTQIDLSYDLSARICRGFMDVIHDHGYLAGLYSMSWILNRDWIVTSGIRDTYEGWVAHVYSDAPNTGITSNEYNIYKDRYQSVYGMHQYSFTTYVNGVGPFDANVCYKDYPGIIMSQGLNGYTENDKEPPVISDVVYSDVSTAGYTVSCRVTDDVGIKRVSFPTWTVANGQDDLPQNFMATQLGTRSGDRYTFRVNASDHNYETGEYGTHIYAEDYAGNVTQLALPVVEVRNDTENPVISDVRYFEMSASGYSVSCKVTDDWGVNSVAFPSWTTQNGQDDLPEQFLTTQLGARDGDRFVFRVNASDHNNEAGEYVTHIYATDCAGNQVNLALDPIVLSDDREDPVISDVQITDVTEEGYTVSCTVTDNWGLNSVVFPTWTEEGGQDDLDPEFFYTQLGTQEGDRYTFRVDIADHKGEQGLYHTHIYATDCADNRVSVELTVALGAKIELVEAADYSLEEALVLGVKHQTTVSMLLSRFANEGLEVVDSLGNVLQDQDYVGTGTRVNLYQAEQVLDTVTVVVMGDMDGNGIVDTTDYMRLKAALRGTFEVDEALTKAADVDGSGKLGAADYMRIKAYFLGTYDLFG